MARTPKPKTNPTVYKIDNNLSFEITHGCPTSSTLVNDFPHGKKVDKVQVYKGTDGNFYLVLTD